jgi:predicted PurR-regulated permease PerM
MSRMVSLIFLVGIILLVGILFYRVMATFLVPLFFAAVFVVLFRPLHGWMLQKCRGRQRLAAGATTAAIMLIVLVPTSLIVTLAVVEGSTLLTHLDAATLKSQLSSFRTRLGLAMPLANDMRAVEDQLARLYQSQGRAAAEANAARHLLERLQEIQRGLANEPRGHGSVAVEPVIAEVAKLQDLTPGTLEYEAALQVAMREFRRFKLALLGGPYRAWLVELANPSDDRLREWSGTVFARAQEWLLSLSGATMAFVGQFLLGTAITVLAIYFFLVDGAHMSEGIMRLLPLDQSHQRELVAEFDRTSRAVVTATLLSAVAQGLLSGLGFWFAGLDSVFLLTALATLLGLVPFVGAAGVWVPACLWLYFVAGRTGPAVGLAIYGCLVISMADNVVKPLVLRGGSKLHPLLALLSVLGGAQLLGAIGILVGPMVVAFLQTLLNILHRELTTLEPRPAA